MMGLEVWDFWGLRLLFHGFCFENFVRGGWGHDAHKSINPTIPNPRPDPETLNPKTINPGEAPNPTLSGF